jgi:tetratricopeptide (TPR) repeat protein
MNPASAPFLCTQMPNFLSDLGPFWARLLLVVVLGVGLAGCGGKGKESTEHQRKQADHLLAEADFAVTLRDWKRAEGLLVQASALVPGDGAVWITLGSVRVRLGNRSAAKESYNLGLKAYEAAAAADKSKTDAEPWLKQVYVLALLGRANDARALLDKLSKQFPGNRSVRAFIDGKQLDRMLADPQFKQLAL